MPTARADKVKMLRDEVERLKVHLQTAAKRLYSTSTWERLSETGRRSLRRWADEAEQAKGGDV